MRCGLGGALSLLAYAFVEQLPFGWRTLFVIGGFGLLCVPWLLRSLNETRRFAGQQEQGEINALGDSAWQPLRDILRVYPGRLIALVGAIAPVALILEPGSVFISKHLQHDLEFSPGQVGLLVALCGIATPVGNMLSGILTDRFGRRPGTIFVSLLLSLADAIFYNSTSMVAVALGLAMLMLSIGGIQVLHIALTVGRIATRPTPTAPT